MKSIIIFLLIISSSAYADHFKVAAYAWEPFIDSKRDDGGISIALVRNIMESQGHTIELVSMPWARSLVMLEKNKVDILPAVWFTQERTKTMLYSESYAANRLVFIKKKGDDYEFNGLSSLYDKVVAVIRDYAYEETFLKDKNIKFSIADSLNSNVKKVITGRADLTLDDEIAAKSIIDSKLLSKIEFTKNALSEIPLFITCDKKNKKCASIIESFNKGLASMKEDGSLAQLFSELGL
jgi:polar amino acid transport system substrate-binding protein